MTLKKFFMHHLMVFFFCLVFLKFLGFFVVQFGIQRFWVVNLENTTAKRPFMCFVFFAYFAYFFLPFMIFLEIAFYILQILAITLWSFDPIRKVEHCKFGRVEVGFRKSEVVLVIVFSDLRFDFVLNQNIVLVIIIRIVP